MPLIRRIVSLLLLSLLAAACQLRIGADVTVAADGSGTLELLVAMDAELAELLDDAGVDLQAGFAEAAAAAPSWELEHDDTAEGREFRFATPFEDPAELTRLVEDLHAALDPEDGRLLRSVELHQTSDGAIVFEAVAGLVPPSTVGATGSEVDIDGEDLRRLLEERGHELARYDLRVTLPADPVSSDADEVDGRTLVWHLPVGDERLVAARSAVPRDDTLLLIGGAALGAFLIAALTVLMIRRRRRVTPGV